MSVAALTPERVVRAVTVCGAAGTALAAAAALDRAGAATVWRRPGAVSLALLAALATSLYGELSPSLQDDELVTRLRRLAPATLVFVAVALVAFPAATNVGLLWVVGWLAAGCAGLAFVPRMRWVALTLASVGALGATVLAEAAAWALIPTAVAWLVVPAIDRLERLRLERPDAVGWGALAGSAAAVSATAGVGAGVFALAWHVLPAHGRAAGIVEGAGVPAPAVGALREVAFPVWELTLLVVFAAALAAALFVVARRRSAEPDRVPDDELPAVDLLDERLAARAPGTDGAWSWPVGCRRELVAAYLRLLALLARGPFARAVGETPARHAERLPGAARAAAARFAERFGRARWGTAPIAPDELPEAEADAAAVLRAVEQERTAPRSSGGPSR